jgi:hypothetical protein
MIFFAQPTLGQNATFVSDNGRSLLKLERQIRGRSRLQVQMKN